MTVGPKAPSERARVRRMHERGAYDRATIDAVLDAQPLAHVAWTLDGLPRVTPTLQWREGDRVYWHGSAASPMLDELLAAFEHAATDDAVRAVVLGSTVPKRFCAGLDLKAFAKQDGDGVRALLERLYTRFTDLQHRLGKPSIAAVNGTARGGGMTLAISCDMAIVDADADLGYPEIDVGVIPAIHFAHLPRIIGRHRAFDLLFTGRAFGAREAVELGLAARIAEPGTALETAHGFSCKKI